MHLDTAFYILPSEAAQQYEYKMEENENDLYINYYKEEEENEYD